MTSQSIIVKTRAIPLVAPILHSIIVMLTVMQTDPPLFLPTALMTNLTINLTLVSIVHQSTTKAYSMQLLCGNSNLIQGPYPLGPSQRHKGIRGLAHGITMRQWDRTLPNGILFASGMESVH